MSKASEIQQLREKEGLTFSEACAAYAKAHPVSDSREARIQAEAVTDAEYLSAHKAYAASLGATTPGDYAKALRVRTSSEHDIALRFALEAARKARASNDSVEACAHRNTELRTVVCCEDCGLPTYLAPQPAPDRVRAPYCPEEGHVGTGPDGGCTACDGHGYLRAPDRVDRIERCLDLLFAGVTGLREDWDRALIAAKEAWEGE